MRDRIIANGVKNLRSFGYPHVTAENILTDEVYRAFFRSMLKDNLGQGKMVDVVILALLEEMEEKGGE